MKLTQKGSTTTNTIAIVLTIIILCVIGFLVWFFGFRGNNTYTPNTVSSQNSQPTASQKESAIKTNWTKFFNGSTPNAQRVALLQNGQQYAQELAGYSQSPLAKQASATVTNVKLNSNGTATVTYTINVSGQPELKNQTGQAVLQNGTWKVGDTSLCGLLSLAGQKPSICQSTSSQQSQSASSSQSQPSSQSNTTK